MMIDRARIYRDRQSLEELFVENPLWRAMYEELYLEVVNMDKTTWGIPCEFSQTPLELFNEVYYQCVRVMYGLPVDLLSNISYRRMFSLDELAELSFIYIVLYFFPLEYRVNPLLRGNLIASTLVDLKYVLRSRNIFKVFEFIENNQGQYKVWDLRYSATYLPANMQGRNAIRKLRDEIKSSMSARPNPESVEKLFKNPVCAKQDIEGVIAEFYNGKNSNLALIEVVLYTHGVIRCANEHTLFARSLRDLGLLPNLDVDKAASSMRTKYKQFEGSDYRTWRGGGRADNQSKCMDIARKLHSK